MLAVRILVNDQKTIPFSPGDISSIKTSIISSQCLDTGEMASVHVNEVFDAMNSSQWVGSVASYSTVKRKSNIRTINIYCPMRIIVIDNYIF